MSKTITLLFIFSINLGFSQSIDFELLSATYENDEKAIFDLLRRGADPNTQSSDGTTPLMYAVQNGNYFICKKLISSGANVDATTIYGVPPLMNAVMNSDTGIVLLLLENNANPDAIHESENLSALLYTIKSDNYFLSKALLQYGADPNKFVDDVSPIMQTIYLGIDTSFVNLLLEYGADPNLKNSKEYTPLMICVLYENIIVTKLLLKNGAIPITYNDSYYAPKNVLEISIIYKLDEFVDLYIPYFEDSLQHYHSKAISSNYLYGAKQIRKQSGKQYLSPTLDKLIITPSLIVNHKDFFGGFKVGFSESRYKINFKFAVMPRLFRKSVLIENRPNYFLQLWEKRTLLILEIDKNFIIKSTSDETYGAYIRAKGVYSYGEYSGTNIKIKHPLVFSPGVGIWKQKEILRFGFGYSYLPIQTNFPHYFEINLSFLIPF